MLNINQNMLICVNNFGSYVGLNYFLQYISTKEVERFL